MIVDSSALIAILRKEADAELYLRTLQRHPSRRISAANWLEAAMVIDGARSPIASRRFDEFVAKARLVVEPVTVEQARIAREAFRDFGKGSGHPARLNFGDGFAYALARLSGEPLLFKGEDFPHTGIRSALTA